MEPPQISRRGVSPSCQSSRLGLISQFQHCTYWRTGRHHVSKQDTWLQLSKTVQSSVKGITPCFWGRYVAIFVIIMCITHSLRWGSPCQQPQLLCTVARDGAPRQAIDWRCHPPQSMWRRWVIRKDTTPYSYDIKLILRPPTQLLWVWCLLFHIPFPGI